MTLVCFWSYGASLHQKSGCNFLSRSHLFSNLSKEHKHTPSLCLRSVFAGWVRDHKRCFESWKEKSFGSGSGVSSGPLHLSGCYAHADTCKPCRISGRHFLLKLSNSLTTKVKRTQRKTNSVIYSFHKTILWFLGRFCNKTSILHAAIWGWDCKTNKTLFSSTWNIFLETVEAFMLMSIVW